MPDTLTQDIKGTLPRAWRYARAMLRHDSDAEDVVGQALLVVARKSNVAPTGQDFWPWFARIIIFEVRNLRRKRACDMSSSYDITPEVSEDRGEREAALQLYLSDIEPALNSLPENERQTIVALYLDGMSTRSAADVLGISKSRVQQLSSSALAKLQRLLKRDENEVRKALGTAVLPVPTLGLAPACDAWAMSFTSALKTQVFWKSVRVAVLIILALGIGGFVALDGDRLFTRDHDSGSITEQNRISENSSVAHEAKRDFVESDGRDQLLRMNSSSNHAVSSASTIERVASSGATAMRGGEVADQDTTTEASEGDAAPMDQVRLSIEGVVKNTRGEPISGAQIVIANRGRLRVHHTLVHDGVEREVSLSPEDADSLIDRQGKRSLVTDALEIRGVATTEADGSFTIPVEVVVKSGDAARFQLQISHSDYQIRLTRPFYAQLQNDSVDLDPLEVILEGGQGDIFGSVDVGSSIGNQVTVWLVKVRTTRQAVLDAAAARGDYIRKAKADKSGAFVFKNLTPANYFLLATGDNGLKAAGQILDLVAQTPELRSLIAKRGYGRAVSTERQPSQGPIHLVSLSAYSLEFCIRQQIGGGVLAEVIAVNAGKRFTFTAPTSIAMSAAGQGRLDGVSPLATSMTLQVHGYEPIEVDISKGDTDLGELQLVPARGQIRGRVQDAHGRVLADVRVSLLHAQGEATNVIPVSRQWDRVTTDEFGAFRFDGVPTGSFSFVIEHEDHGRRSAGLSQVSISDNACVHEVVLDFRDTYTLNVKVMIGKGGWQKQIPENGVALSLRLVRDTPEARAKRMSVMFSAIDIVSFGVNFLIPGADAASTNVTLDMPLRGIPAGRYLLLAILTEPGVFTLNSELLPLSVGEDQKREKDVNLKLGFETKVSGEVQDAHGRPFAGQQLELIPDDDACEAHATVLATRTDAVGRYSFQGMPPGSYRLRLTSHDRWNGEAPTITISERGEWTLDGRMK